MVKVQSALIDLAKKLIKYSDEVSEHFTEKYYECLTLICKRDELSLNCLGFESYDEILIKKAKLSKLHNQKLKVGVSFQGFIYQTFKIIINKLKLKGISNAERNFIEYFCAMAYFCIPEIRQQLLDAFKDSFILLNKDEEMKDTFKYDIKEIQIKNKHFMSLFDWEKDFYRYLRVKIE